jgi:hypothetical protein
VPLNKNARKEERVKFELTIEIEVSLKDAKLSDIQKITQQLLATENIEAIKSTEIKSIRKL